MTSITIITGFWNLDYDQEFYASYKKNFKQLLKCGINMCIYADPLDEQLIKLIWKYRSESNTKILYKSADDFKTWFEFYSLVQKISDSITLSKMFLLHDVKITNPFNSSYVYWIDPNMSIDNMLLNNLPHYTDYVDKFVTMNGFLFGGSGSMITKMNTIYHGYLSKMLSENLIETEECIFRTIANKYPDMISYTESEELKKYTKACIITHVYVLAYNFPDQFEYLLDSFEKSDINFLNKPQKFLINNSTDRSTDFRYDLLCEKYGFEQIKKDNIGICGGRQFVAEHFEQSGADYYIFFEDDMLLHESNTNFCQGGFRTYVDGLYNKTLSIMRKEKYDFLKLNFTEVYGGNDTQWAWYNVPDDIRHKYFPLKLNKPEFGLDPNPPLTQFTTIHKYEDIMYIEGEIYYCNWPMWFSQEGNKKVFLDPKYEHPFEQTWMSLVFQKQKDNLFKVAVLLLSPINHCRIHYYQSSERREN